MKARRVLGFPCIAILLLAAPSTALALANRVFVSARSGNDANSCDSITTPCQTFAGAVLQLNPGGEAIVLDSGGYGPVTITQSLTIEAPPGVLAFVHPPSGDAITVNAGTIDRVVLRGLVLNGGFASAITVNSVGNLHIESCVISGFGNEGVSFKASGTLFMNDTFVRENHGASVWVRPGSGHAYASIDHCRLEANGNGVLVSGSTAPALVTVRDSVVSGNGNGFEADSVDGELNLENCIAANNGLGIGSFTGALVRVSNSTVSDNITGLFSDGPSKLLSRSNNTVRGNNPNGSFTGTFAAD